MAIHFDTQGPAPDGFHVPLNTEWQAIRDVWAALGGWSSDWTNFWIALKLPFAGNRNYSSSGVENQGTIGSYWSSNPYDSNNSYYLYFRSSGINSRYDSYRSYGRSVRCFKNSPTIPTSSWTKLYWTSIEAGWIFWSSTDWLISLSSDWTTWITIMDKNLGATTVWNSWDTLSEANCWKYYQRWNNYGFSRYSVDPIATSSTQVDASTYWPWNYYSSSTFITSWLWDSSYNDNLRWWVSQWMRYDPIRLHWAIQTFHWKRPYEWKPWANTLAYWKLNWSLNDEKWNYNLTNSWTSFYNDASIWRQVLYCDGSTHYVYTTSLPSSNTDKITINIWTKGIDLYTNQRNLFDTRLVSWQNRAIRWECTSSSVLMVIWWTWASSSFDISVTSSELNSRGLWTITYDTSTKILNAYFNWEFKWTWTWTTAVDSSTWLSNFTLWIWFQLNSTRSYKWYISDTIIENKIRTADEVAKYYNRAKWNYQSSNGWWGTQGAAIQ